MFATMKDNAIDGVAEFLLKEEEIRRTLERDATATRLDYYFGTTWKARLFVLLAIIAIASVGGLDFRNGNFWAALQELEGIKLAFVYGSFAAGSAGSASDVDLMVVGSIGLRKIAPRLRRVADVIGREINPHVIAEESYRKKLARQDSYIFNVTNGEKIWIIGDDNELGKLVQEWLAAAP